VKLRSASKLPKDFG
jgi:hypothetical protein